MRVVIVGMGVQGNKRKKFLGRDFAYSVDKFKKADFQSISEVPLNKFDTVFACVPDKQKLQIANYCIDNNKHILKHFNAKQMNKYRQLFTSIDIPKVNIN